MARYKLLSQAVIDGALREAGEEIEYDGEPGPHMELIKGKAPAPAKKPQLDPDLLNHPEDDDKGDPTTVGEKR